VDDRPPTRRPPYATTRVWPPPQHEPPSSAGTPWNRPSAAEGEPAEGRPAPGEDALPPSARWYGTPAPPPPRRIPRWLARTLVAAAVLVVGGGLVAGLVSFVVDRVRAATAPPATVTDTLAGVRYQLPPEWRAGKVAPVTAFTSVAVRDGDAIVMSGPGDPVRASELRRKAEELGEVYARLLLHGDKVTVVDDRSLTVNGRAAHTRSLRAEYEDVVNRPSYLRVMVIEGERSGTVMLGMAQPDEPRLRADVNRIMDGVR
jgi:hypothetical protein